MGPDICLGALGACPRRDFFWRREKPFPLSSMPDSCSRRNTLNRCGVKSNGHTSYALIELRPGITAAKLFTRPWHRFLILDSQLCLDIESIYAHTYL